MLSCENELWDGGFGYSFQWVFVRDLAESPAEGGMTVNHATFDEKACDTHFSAWYPWPLFDVNRPF